MENQSPRYYELLAPRTPALDLSYVNHLLSFKAIEEPRKCWEMQQQLNNCLGAVSSKFVTPTSTSPPYQPLSLNAQANDFIPNSKSSATVSTPITQFEDDKRFFYRNGALYNRMCFDPRLSFVEIEPNLEQENGDQNNKKSNYYINPFDDDDHLLVTDSDLQDEYEAGYDPMDAPIPNIKGICFKNPYFESDENLVDMDVTSDPVPHLHFAKMFEKSRMPYKTSLSSGFANGLSHSKNYYKPLKQQRFFEKTVETQETIQKSEYQRMIKTRMMEPTDDDETLQNLRLMVDNLLLEPPAQNNPNDKGLMVINGTPIATFFKEDQNKEKIQQQQPTVRRGRGRIRSSGFTEMFGIYTPPTIRQHRYSLPEVSESKNIVAANTVTSLFNDKTKPKDSPILTLPTTQRRLARKGNFCIAQKNDWPSLPIGES